MKAAIYARYSTEMQKESSIEDQIRVCERHASQHNFIVLKKFCDRAISGTVSIRPEYQMMRQSALNGEFDVLLVHDLSRLARDNVEMQTMLREFSFHDIRVISIADGYDNQKKGSKILAGFKGVINELYIDDLREKVHRGMEGVILDGKIAGGRLYGYDNIPITDENNLDSYGRPEVIAVKRLINKEQAVVVQKIYNMYLQGHSVTRIAKHLNDLDITSPSGRKWSHSTLLSGNLFYGVLDNPHYIGKIYWNRTRWIKDPSTGKRKPKLNPENEWVKYENQELQIIDKEVFNSVQNMLKEKRTSKREYKAPRKYLFSGLLQCAECGNNYVKHTKDSYICRGHKRYGLSVCTNNKRISNRILEDVLLEEIKERLLNKESISILKRTVSQLLKEQSKEQPRETEKLSQRLNSIKKEIDNIIDFIAKGKAFDSLHNKLDELEEEKLNIETKIAGLKKNSSEIIKLVPNLIEKYKEAIANLNNSLEDNIEQAREALKGFLGNKIKLHKRDGELVAEIQQMLPSAVKNLWFAGVAEEGLEPPTLGL